jgi:hypothetical protein
VNPQDRSSHQGHWRTPPTEPVGRTNHVPGFGPQMQSQPLPQPHIPNMYAGWPQQVYPYPQPFPPQRRTRRKVVAVVALPLLAVGLLVLVAVALHTLGGAATSRDEVPTSAPVAAVCQPGSYDVSTGSTTPTLNKSGLEAPTFQGATDVAVCTAKVAIFAEPVRPGEQYGPIWIVQFSSPGAARSEAARENLLGATVIATISGKTVLFSAPADWTGASLEPLAQFGFTITPARCEGRLWMMPQC